MTRRAGSTLGLGDVLEEAARGIADTAGVQHCIIYLYYQNSAERHYSPDW
jgi:hypothetical protein